MSGDWVTRSSLWPGFSPGRGKVSLWPAGSDVAIPLMSSGNDTVFLTNHLEPTSPVFPEGDALGDGSDGTPVCHVTGATDPMVMIGGLGRQRDRPDGFSSENRYLSRRFDC